MATTAQALGDIGAQLDEAAASIAALVAKVAAVGSLISTVSNASIGSGTTAAKAARVEGVLVATIGKIMEQAHALDCECQQKLAAIRANLARVEITGATS